MRRFRWLVPFAVAVLGVLLLPAYVSAHAAYDRSAPNRDEVVQTPPATVEVFFKQEVFRTQGSNFVHVFSDAGTQVSDGDGIVDDNNRAHIVATLQSNLDPGRYIVRWKTLSDIDGDEGEGAFCFYIAVQPSAAEQQECSAFNTTEETTPSASATQPAVPTASTTAAVSTPVPTAVTPGGKDSGSGTSTGVVVAIIAGVVLVVVVGGGAIVWLRRTLQ